MLDARQLCRLVDHTLLKPEATQQQIEQLCADADRLHTRTVCVNGLWVPAAAQALSGSSVDVCSVVGFPLGAMHVSAVLAETAAAIEGGAAEIDMVIPLGYVKAGDWTAPGSYVSAVRGAMPSTARLKVILEPRSCSDSGTRPGLRGLRRCRSRLRQDLNGFHRCRRCDGPRRPVDARDRWAGRRSESGGWHPDLVGCVAMLEAGADRLGLSATSAGRAELDPAPGQLTGR